MAEQTETVETPILDLLMSMSKQSIEAASGLDPKTLMLVRIGALVAMDAPAISYMLNLGVAGEVDVDAEQVEGVLAAVAPIVGTARIASAAQHIVEALAVEIKLEQMEREAEAESAG